MWHKQCSLTHSEVLGKLGCVVTSKNLGIGTAKQSWKQVKLVKSGQRASVGAKKARKQVLICGGHQQMKAKLKRKRLEVAGTSWDDNDFACCRMDAFCSEIVESLQTNILNAQVRNVHVWKETWEKKKLCSNGNNVF